MKGKVNIICTKCINTKTFWLLVVISLFLHPFSVYMKFFRWNSRCKKLPQKRDNFFLKKITKKMMHCKLKFLTIQEIFNSSSSKKQKISILIKKSPMRITTFFSQETSNMHRPIWQEANLVDIWV